MTYLTLASAEALIKANQDDDGWTYNLEPRGKYWVVAVRDEDGEPLGYL